MDGGYNEVDKWMRQTHTNTHALKEMDEYDYQYMNPTSCKAFM